MALVSPWETSSELLLQPTIQKIITTKNNAQNIPFDF
jgi:hypothetical protein